MHKVSSALTNRFGGHSRKTENAFSPENYTAWKQAQAIEDQRALDLQREVERKARMTKKLMQRSGVQERFLTASLDNYELYAEGQAKAIVACRQFLASFASHGAVRNMLFCGSTGTGKNHMASAICNALNNSGRSAVVATAMEIQMRVRASRRVGSEITEEQAMKAFAEMDLLVLDEIELGSTQDYDAKIVNAVIDQRVVRRKSTIILTNLGLQHFAQFVGDRINDRLGESLALVECHWPSYRTRQR